MTKLEILPERVVHVQLGTHPDRRSILPQLEELARALRSRGLHDVLVQAQEVEEFDRELDIHFANWVVFHYHQLQRFAIVVDGDGCRRRVERIAFITGKTFRTFDAPHEARNWLRT